MELQLIERLTLPAGYGKALRLREGQQLKLINIHGTQAVDTWAFVDGDMSEHLSMDNLRSFNSTVYVNKGVALVSNHRRPLISIVEDTSAGNHDTLLCACNADIYRQLGVQGYHRSCADNLHEALAELSLSLPFTPSPLNMFMNVSVNPDGSLNRLLPTSAPGSYVTLRAETDVVVAFSCCPQDVTTINGLDRKPRDCTIEIYAPASQPGASS
ncbi:DUF1989 domain-containing protein [Rhodoligotrophos defluvii]|uniref:DUF1989 domain-containing protein n=1 Tax=Rhodoligotrophos defluvii TaxID=2561934 RepID=UPI0010C955F4|nr:urea carboxylase-associated family protein [Rhodoligotrophos defluvii]